MLRLLHWVGGTLALGGVVFVALRLQAYAGQIDIVDFATADWLALVALSAAYGLSNVWLAMAWRNLLAFCGELTSAAWAIRTYGVSQLAKYVPGNIAHFIGRQAIGVSAGLAGWPLAQSALWELGLIAAAGVLFGFLAAPLVISFPPLLALVLFAVSVAIALLATRLIVGPLVATALLQQTMFLAMSGAMFVGAVAIITPSSLTPLSWAPICGAYIIAWLTGLVTPGAPAGVGVREGVLLFLLHDIMEPADLLVAVLAARLVSIVGDCLFFAAALMIPVRGVHD